MPVYQIVSNSYCKESGNEFLQKFVRRMAQSKSGTESPNRNTI